MERNAFDHLFDMSERTVIVTGGTRGIGLALAEGFALAGANVVVASRKSDACERVATGLRELGTKAIGVATHMGAVDDLDALVGRAVAEFGGIDVVVNNAANALAEPLGALTLQAWNKSFETNLRGPVFLVQKALPYLKESPGAAVLNVVAVSAFGFAPAVSMYAAGKAALMSFTRSMAAEFARFGIRVNALAPGPVDTDMMRNNEPEFINALSEATLQRRLATPDEMVAPALLLTAPGGSNITGQVLIVDGGGTPH
jgi:NAD(P)-dependent dehydrogenase (short-subunit alcohol dehydrogenase family)